MIVSVFERKEKKCIIEKATAIKILPLLLRHMMLDDYAEKTNGYSVTGVYFDTPEHSVVRNSLSKPYYKEKLRMRCYDLPKDKASPVFLEIKKKIGGVGCKRRVLLSYGEAVKFVADHKLPEGKEPQADQILREIKYYLDRTNVKPSTYLTYKRIALKGKDDSSLRVTVDYDIMSRHDNVSLAVQGFNTRVLPENVGLLEIKFTSALPLWLVRIMSENNIRITGFSKFGNDYLNMQEGTLLECAR